MPQSAALTFVKRKTEAVGEGTQPQEAPSTKRAAKPVARRTSEATETKQPLTLRRVQPSFEPFSTRIRRELKRQLKRLSHQREDEGLEVCTVQQFVDEALTDWLERQPDHNR